MYMLDTNICIYLMKHNPPEVREHFNRLHPGDVFISAIVLAELEYGVAGSSRRERNREIVEKFLLPLEIAPFREQDAVVYGEVRAALEKAGAIIGANDLLIAAHALSMGMTLVTNNEREFSRVSGLKVENWIKA